MIEYVEIVLRLLLATVLGGLIGVERERKNRAAGFRTHILVTLGSALIMLVSVNMGPNADDGRIAAQVVSGIGFLGAGTILRSGENVKGLTTAASLWVCGGIGLAIGSGYYVGGIATFSIVLLSLSVLNNLEKTVLRSNYKLIRLKCMERPGLIGDIGQIFGNNNIIIKEMQISRDDDEDNIIEIEFSLVLDKNINFDYLSTIIYDIKGVKDISYKSI